MCGIAGIVDYKNGINPESLRQMTDAIAHRGPDAEGFLFAHDDGITLLQSFSHPEFLPTCALGHRRLSIIDLEGGKQPLSNEDETVWVTYNGEIYNHLELRNELKKCGHEFKSDHSDTEVIVHAYEQWGVNSFNSFNGIFAFGLLDLKKRKMVIVRDHFGVKPVYYYFHDGRFVFSSEIKGILASGNVERTLDVRALHDYLSFRYVPSPLTTFKNIFKLAAGSFLEYDLNSSCVSNSGSFTPAVTEIDGSRNLNQCVIEYQLLFEQAVKRQMISDVEVGALLSGGVDSSAVCSIAARHLSTPLRTYTVGFKDFPEGNELDEAAHFAKQLGSIHKSVIIDNFDFVRVLDDVAWFMDEPTATSSAIPLYYLTKEVHKDVKVVLTGQGADEPLAGYSRYCGERLYQSGFRYLDFLQPIVEKLPRQEQLKRAFRSFCQHDQFERFIKVYYLFNPSEINGLLKEPLPHRNNPLLYKLYHQYKADDQLGKMLYMDTRAWLPDDLLIYGDKATMINSIEARVPILDNDLIRFIESVPSKFKLSFLMKGKLMHKKACEKWLPPFVIKRPKKGFATPIDKWFRNELGGYVKDQLLSGKIGQSLLKPAMIEDMIEKHQSGRQNYQRQLFALLMIEKWAHVYNVTV